MKIHNAPKLTDDLQKDRERDACADAAAAASAAADDDNNNNAAADEEQEDGVVEEGAGGGRRRVCRTPIMTRNHRLGGATFTRRAQTAIRYRGVDITKDAAASTPAAAAWYAVSCESDDGDAYSSSSEEHNDSPSTSPSSSCRSVSSVSSTNLQQRRVVVNNLLQLIRRRQRLVNHELSNRMVLEPKFADYGSIHSIGEVVNRASQDQSDVDSAASVHDLIGANGNAPHPPPPHHHPPNQLPPPPPPPSAMTQGDLYQRQPLLPTPTKGDMWGSAGHPDIHAFSVEEDDDGPALQPHPDQNGVIKINMPAPVREEPRFPQERWKTLIAAVIMFFSSLLVLISLATTHERVPDRKAYGPLPDIFFDLFGVHDWGLTVSEYLIIFAFNSTLVVIVLHKHRFIIARRLFLIMSLLYIYRSVTMFVTVLPISSTTYYCSPKSNHTTTLDMAKRVVQMLSGMGLSINGKQTYCGDFIYSGHTLTIVISYLFISEYTPKKLYLMHWLYWAVAIMGVFMLQWSRSHYTIDVIIAYYVTTRIFWMYHTLANNTGLKQASEKNLLSRVWWFNLFLYFEGNVGGQVPRQWPDWPFPWPRRLHAKSRDS